METTVCFVVGARPNFMKTAPVLRALVERGAGRPLLVHTGQHYDPEMSEVFLEQLGIEPPDVVLGVGSGTHAAQTARALIGIENVLLERRPALVVAPGDVNSTLAAALAAVKLGIPVCHLEAGLRSGDRSMPEEHNRVVADHVSSLLLTHSENASENLIREGLDPSAIHLVGNTMIDSLLEHVGAAVAARPWEKLGIEPDAFGLATLHRPSLVDEPALLRATVDALIELARQRPVVFPAHPRTSERLESLGLGDLEAKGLIVTPPLDYLAFLGLEARAAFVLTDSGGVQEETSALGVPCFTLRSTTERPVTIELGTNTLLGLDPGRIREIPRCSTNGSSASPSRSGTATPARARPT